MIRVSKSKEGDYKTIQEAINAVEESEGESIIYIDEGIYVEQVEVRKNNVKIIGVSPQKTIIKYGLYANEIMADGYKRGTFRTYSFLIYANNFTAENISFINDAGLGKEVRQAIALYVDGDNIVFNNCHIIGNQDTLFTGPLPEKEFEPRGFVGPLENAPRINGRHYYKSCFIKGDIDFIFGSSTALFEDCEIFSNDINEEINGYIAAPSTPQNQKYGYVFKWCKFTSNAKANSVYLARPWREHAKAVFIECDLGAHINSRGFNDWNKSYAHKTMYFAEYNNYGLGANDKAREDYVVFLTEDEVKEYTKDKIFESK